MDTAPARWGRRLTAVLSRVWQAQQQVSNSAREINMTKEEELAEVNAAQNELWLALWQLAAKYDPEETANIAKQLNSNDAKIEKLLGQNNEDQWSRDSVSDGP